MDSSLNSAGMFQQMGSGLPAKTTSFYASLYSALKRSLATKVSCHGPFSKVAPLPDSIFQKLDQIDQGVRRSAYKSGHSHPLAKGQARRADGRLSGRVQSCLCVVFFLV